MNDSFIDRKERWAQRMREKLGEAERARSTARLPPGQHVTRELPVLDLGIHPGVPTDEWRLVVDGAVESPLALDWETFGTLPVVESVSDFHCVTTWSRFDCRWEGVRLREIVDRVRPCEGVKYVFFTCYDGYTTNVRIEDIMGDDALLAKGIDGRPLPLAHGGPLRIVIPHLYAWKSPKFLRRIEFRHEDEPGYWERRGYSMTADPWTEDRFRRR